MYEFVANGGVNGSWFAIVAIYIVGILSVVYAIAFFRDSYKLRSREYAFACALPIIGTLYRRCVSEKSFLIIGITRSLLQTLIFLGLGIFLTCVELR
jgi:type II secretory pathway component PulF